MRWIWLAAVVIWSGATTGIASQVDWIQQVPVEGGGTEQFVYIVDWKGGSALDYYEGVADALKSEVNIVLSPTVGAAEIPAFSVQRVLWDEVVNLPTSIVPRLRADIRPGSFVSSEEGEGIVRAASPTVVVAYPGGATRPSDKTETDRFDLSFAGGTVEQYVNAIRAKRPDANVVLMPGAGSFSAPPVDLSQVTLGAALNVLDGQERMQRSGTQQVGVDRIMDGARALHRISVHGAIEPPEQTGVWDVAEILESGTPVEDVLTAVEATLQLYDAPGKMQFHEQTSLLLMRGPQEQLEAVERVLDAVLAAASVRKHTRDQRAEELRRIEREIADTVSEYEILREDLSILEGIVDRLKAEAEESRVDPVQVDEKKRELLRVRGEVRRLQREIEMLEEERDRLRGLSESDSQE